ncbi:MAG: hypothetical protein KJ983_02360, partial [Candidatus Omnitrophica bacterium]|nr:hypothetical protein [Candidatus Omnitrophota bacterium]
MPTYSSKQNIKSGVPLGGIGAGKLEITPYGTIDYITYQNNWTKPIENKTNKEKGRAQGILGNHFAVYIRTPAATISKLLQTEKVKDYNVIKNIHFEGWFPFAYLDYNEQNFPIEISLLAYSFFIPGDIKHSSLPAAVFEFELKNKLPREVDIGLIFMVRNLVSKNSVGRLNVLRKEKKITGIEFRQRKPDADDVMAGEVFISLPKQTGEISFLSEWNMQKSNFYFEPNIRLYALDYFEKEGKLPNINPKKMVQSQSIELGGALAVKFKLKPNQTKKAPFVYSWYFPRNQLGHFYERSFRNSRDVAAYVHNNLDALRLKNSQFLNILNEMGLEEWFKDALMNNLYTLFSSSWFTRSGDFTMYEAPLICPLMGTLDVYFYSSVAVGLLFPTLDKKALLLFKKSIRKNGYIPHDI